MGRMAGNWCNSKEPRKMLAVKVTSLNRTVRRYYSLAKDVAMLSDMDRPSVEAVTQVSTFVAQTAWTFNAHGMVVYWASCPPLEYACTRSVHDNLYHVHCTYVTLCILTFLHIIPKNEFYLLYAGEWVQILTITNHEYAIGHCDLNRNKMHGIQWEGCLGGELASLCPKGKCRLDGHTLTRFYRIQNNCCSIHIWLEPQSCYLHSSRPF